MKYLLRALIIFLLVSCQEEIKTQEIKADSVVVVHKKQPIDTKRKIVSRTPVEVFSKPITGSAIQGEFGVRIFETVNTFHYLMKVRYAEMVVTDTLRLPNMGVMPELKIISAKEPNACIVGFLDEKKEFKEFKLVRVKNDKLSIKQIKHYAVATYQVN